MAKFLVTKDTGPAVIEADEAGVMSNGMLMLTAGEGQTQSVVAAFVPGAWRTMQKLVDGEGTVH